MANVDAAFGFVPIRHMSGNAPRTNKYTIASGYAANIFKGDLCILVTAGTVQVSAAAAENNIGVFAGVSYTASDGSYVYSEYWPSGTVATDIIAYIYDCPYTVFKVQSAGTTNQSSIGSCAELLAGTGSTLTGQSGFETSGTMADTKAQLKIHASYDAPDNTFGVNGILEVTINEHLLGTNIAGI